MQRWRRKFETLKLLVKWRKELGDIVRNAKRIDTEAEELKLSLDKTGLSHLISTGDPTKHIGAALELAAHFGLEFHKGTSYGDCCVSLPKDRWDRSISKYAHVWSYSNFMEADPKEVESISAWSAKMPIAICRCLVKATEAGVI